jgi:hypothetical protein
VVEDQEFAPGARWWCAAQGKNVVIGQQTRAACERQADHKLGRASLMVGPIAPLPFQLSPFSSSPAKQLG